MKQNKLRTAMTVAETVSFDSHDTETKVGCVLVRKESGAIVGTGFNGFIRGAPDNLLPTNGDDKHPYMQHAEKNLMSNCIREGISARDCVVVCTHTPCVDCTRFLWQCGIDEVIVKNIHSSFDKVRAMKDLKVCTEPAGPFTRIQYSRRKNENSNW